MLDINAKIEELQSERSVITAMDTTDEIEKKVAEYRASLQKEFEIFVKQRLIAIDAKLEVYNEFLAYVNAGATESEADNMA